MLWKLCKPCVTLATNLLPPISLQWWEERNRAAGFLILIRSERTVVLQSSTCVKVEDHNDNLVDSSSLVFCEG